jgi:hypothetical protein
MSRNAGGKRSNGSSIRKILGNSPFRGGTLTHIRCLRFCCPRSARLYPFESNRVTRTLNEVDMNMKQAPARFCPLGGNTNQCASSLQMSPRPAVGFNVAVCPLGRFRHEYSQRRNRLEYKRFTEIADSANHEQALRSHQHLHLDVFLSFRPRQTMARSNKKRGIAHGGSPVEC